MKFKHSAAELKSLALARALSRHEARAFAAFHADTLDAANHTDYVAAFVLQLGAPAQHAAILTLLAGCVRDFRGGKIAYKPPNTPQLTSVLDVGRWVSAQLDGGLAHADVRCGAPLSGLRPPPPPPYVAVPAPRQGGEGFIPSLFVALQVLERAPRVDLGSIKKRATAGSPTDTSIARTAAAPYGAAPAAVSVALPAGFAAPPLAAPLAIPPEARAMAALEHVQLCVPRHDTLALVAGRTRLLADFATRRTLTGDVALAQAAREGSLGLLQLFDRGTQDRKDLETLVCSALRERGHVLVFTSVEFLLDGELVALLGEADRREGVRRADAYLVVQEAGITWPVHRAAAAEGRASEAAFFKRAHRLGLVVGVSVKSDLGFRNRRESSGELHLDHCPLVLFVLPRINACAGALCDVVVRANVRRRLAPTPSGAIRYVGPPLASGRLDSLDALRYVLRGVFGFVHITVRKGGSDERVWGSRMSQGQPGHDRRQDGCRRLARPPAPLDGHGWHTGGRRLARAACGQACTRDSCRPGGGRRCCDQGGGERDGSGSC